MPVGRRSTSLPMPQMRFTAEMKQLLERANDPDADLEDIHTEVDALIIECLRSNGYDNGCTILKRIKLWKA